MNFVIDLAHRGVSVAQWLEHRSAECEDLRFDSSWGLEFFSLSHARDKTKTSFSVYRFHFLLQRYYLVGLAVVSYPVSRDVSYATSDVCLHARGWGISNKCKDRSAVWARTDSTTKYETTRYCGILVTFCIIKIVDFNLSYIILFFQSVLGWWPCQWKSCILKNALKTRSLIIISNNI